MCMLSHNMMCNNVRELMKKLLNVCLPAGSVTRESPGLPATKVTLNCRDQKTSTNLTADFPEGVLLFGSSSTREVTIHIVSKSDEGLYKCNISNVGEPLESWLADRGKTFK